MQGKTEGSVLNSRVVLTPNGDQLCFYYYLTTGFNLAFNEIVIFKPQKPETPAGLL